MYTVEIYIEENELTAFTFFVIILSSGYSAKTVCIAQQACGKYNYFSDISFMVQRALAAVLALHRLVE